MALPIKAINKYSTGQVRYNSGGLGPNAGKALDPIGYQERNRTMKARNTAILRRMQANQKGNYMSSAWLKGSK